MNNEKIILEIIDNDQQIVIKKFKSILNLSKAYPHIPYNNLRMIYLDNKKEVQFNIITKSRSPNQLLKNKFKIYDNPEYLDRFIIE